MPNRETEAHLPISQDEPLTVELFFDAVHWVSANRKRQLVLVTKASQLQRELYGPSTQDPKRVVRG